MKPLFTFLICFFSYSLVAQNTYNNKIGEVKELNIYGADAKVIIGKIIINQASDPPQIQLLQSLQQQQPDGNYLTSFAFGHNSIQPFYAVNLKLTFSKSVDSLKEEGVSMWTGDPSNHGLSKDNLSYVFVANKIETVIFEGKIAFFVIRIKSKYKIQTTITGVAAN
jgi:hypothetical protein